MFTQPFAETQIKKPKLCVTGLCEGIPRWPVNSPHKGPVTREMFPFDEVIMVLKVPKFVHNTFDIWASCMEQFVKVIIVMQWHGNSQADLKYSSLDQIWKWVFAHDLNNLYKQSKTYWYSLYRLWRCMNLVVPQLTSVVIICHFILYSSQSNRYQTRESWEISCHSE